MPTKELCEFCDEPTGRAGRGEDSIYVETTNGERAGPLCTACRDQMESDGKAVS